MTERNEGREREREKKGEDVCATAANTGKAREGDFVEKREETKKIHPNNNNKNTTKEKKKKEGR